MRPKLLAPPPHVEGGAVEGAAEGSFFPIEMMPGFLQTFARVLPLYYVNEGLRASMIFRDNMAARRHNRGLRGRDLRLGPHSHQMGRG